MARFSTAGNNVVTSVKTCSVCGELKLLNAFHRSSSSRDGRQSSCKACQREYRKLRYRRLLSAEKVELLEKKEAAKPGFKVCTKCRLEKELEAFSSHSGTKSGKHSWCRVCLAADGIRRRASSPENRLKNSLNTARNSARRKGIAFEISLDDLRSMWEAQQGRCFYTGVRMSYEGSGSNESVSLDRVDSSGGYTVDNIVLCCNRVNTMKGAMSTSDLIRWCGLVLEHMEEVRHR